MSEGAPSNDEQPEAGQPGAERPLVAPSEGGVHEQPAGGFSPLGEERAPVEVDEDWLGNLWGWVKAHPVFALVLAGITFVLPVALQRGVQEMTRRRVEAQLGAWRDRLEDAGWPVPYREERAVDPPYSVDLPSAALTPLGLAEEHAVLSGWSALLGGRAPEGLEALEDPRAAGLRACEALRRAAQAERAQGAAVGWSWPVPGAAREALGGVVPVARAEQRVQLEAARAEWSKLPLEARPLLEAAARLVEGDAARVLAEEGRQEGSVGAQVAWEALQAEARRVRAVQIVRQDPPIRDDLEVLVHLARTDAAGVRGVLKALGPAGVARCLRPGGGDVERARAFLEVCQALEDVGAAWTWIRGGVRGVLVHRWRRFGEPWEAPRALWLAWVAQDPTADLPPEAFAGWEEVLPSVVDDDRLLFDMARRFFEVGVVPAAFEEFLGRRVAGRSAGEGASPGSVGAWVEEALGASVRLEAQGAAVAAEDAAAARERWAQVEETLGERADPSALRLRAQATFWRAQLDAQQGAWDEARAGFATARAEGYRPVVRTHQAEGRAAGGSGDWAAAAQAAQVGLAALDALRDVVATARSDMDQGVALDLEVRGLPVTRRVWARLRAELQLLQARAAFEQGQTQVAAELASGVAQARPDLCEAWWVVAKSALAEGWTDMAREAIASGTRAARGTEWAPRFTELTPN